VKIEELPEGMQEGIRESDSQLLKFRQYIPRSERYYYGLFPKPRELFSPLPGVQDIWVCVDHEYATTSITRLLVHTLKHHRGGSQ
jgi:hypothetical protein